MDIDKNKQITITYLNHRGAITERNIIPVELWYGVNEWHDYEQWFMKAYDTDKQDTRDFALANLKSVANPSLINDNQNVEVNNQGAKEVKLFSDGGSRGNPGPSALGFVIYDMSDQEIYKSSRYLGVTTNNQAEYLGLKDGLEWCQKNQVEVVHIYMDSLLVVNQIKGIFKVKNRELWPIHDSIKELMTKFKKINISHVPRELNKTADAMVNDCLDKESE